MTIAVTDIKACVREIFDPTQFQVEDGIVTFGFIDENDESTDIGVRVSDDPVQYLDRKRQLVEITSTFNRTRELRIILKRPKCEVLKFLLHANQTLNWSRMFCCGSEEEGFCFLLYCCADAKYLDVDDISLNRGESDFILTI